MSSDGSALARAQTAALAYLNPRPRLKVLVMNGVFASPRSRMKCDGTRALAGLGFLIHPPPPATPLSPIAYGRRASVMVVIDV